MTRNLGLQPICSKYAILESHCAVDEHELFHGKPFNTFIRYTFYYL